MTSAYRYLFSILILVFAQVANAQIVQSSCITTDSVSSSYYHDAAYLTYDYIYETGDASTNQIELPLDIQNQFLDALVAVYNATELNVRDTIVELYNIHHYPELSLNSVSIGVDSNAFWYNQLKDSIIPTGYQPFDDLQNEYGLTVQDIIDNNSVAYHRVILSSDSFYNVDQYQYLFSNLAGVSFTQVLGYVGDGNYIKGDIENDKVHLTYSYGWGDCPSGCIYRKYWEFTVHPNCVLEYKGCYGSNVTSVGSETIENLTTYPNPVNETLYFSENIRNSKFKVLNAAGQTSHAGVIVNGNQINLSKLRSGVYLLLLEIDGMRVMKKIVKY